MNEENDLYVIPEKPEVRDENVFLTFQFSETPGKDGVKILLLQ